MKKLIVVIIYLSITLLLISCQKIESEDQKTLKIAYSSYSEFKRDYGSTLEQRFENVNFQVIEYNHIIRNGVWDAMKYIPTEEDWDEKEFIDFIETESPDLIFFPSQLYSSLTDNNLLHNLSISVEEENNFNIASPVINSLKGSGEIYALPNSMTSQAIFYNKDLFREMGINEPIDQMTWSELLMLAMQFSNSDVKGLYTPYYDIADLLIEMGKADNRKWYEASGEITALFNTESWQGYIETELNFLRSKTLFIESEIPLEAFIDGKIAMILETNEFLSGLKTSDVDFEWGIVTEPVGRENFDQSSTISFPMLNGISSKTMEFETSLEVWKYLNSQNVARTKLNQGHMFTLPVMNFKEGTEMDKFYLLSPNPHYMFTDSVIPIKLKQKIEQIIYDSLQNSLNNNIPLVDTIDTMQGDITNEIFKSKNE